MPAPDRFADVPTASHQFRACRSPRAWLFLLSIVLVGVAADLGSKRWAFRDVLIDTANPNWMPPPHPPIDLLPGGFLTANTVVNRGAVFGIADDQRLFFIAFTVAALAGGLVVFGCMPAIDRRAAHASIGLILAGGLGNLHDRVFYGFVRDFVHMMPGANLPFGWRWPSGSPEMFPWVFNIADMLLLVGMLLLLGHLNRSDRAATTAPSSAGMIGNHVPSTGD